MIMIRLGVQLVILINHLLNMEKF